MCAVIGVVNGGRGVKRRMVNISNCSVTWPVGMWYTIQHLKNKLQ